MNSNIKDFLLRINYDYFYRTLRFDTKGNFNPKSTTSNIRKYIKDEFKYELPFYKHMEFQKDMRIKLKELESITIDSIYYDELYYLYDRLDFDLVDKHDRSEIQSIFESICRCEQHHFFIYDESDENVFLSKIYKKLIKQLKK